MTKTLGLKAIIGLVMATAITASVVTVSLALPFSDTASSPFVDEIDEITDSGCASGFPDGTFKPTDGVKRQQFAYWLANCGGRIASTSATNTLTYGGTAQQVALTDSFNVPGATGSGQTQQLHLQGIVDVGSEVLNFPDFCAFVVVCSVDVQLYHGSTQVAEQTVRWNNGTGDISPDRLTVPVQAVIEVATGTTVNYGLRVQGSGLEASAGKAYNRSLTATLVPFSG